MDVEKALAQRAKDWQDNGVTSTPLRRDGFISGRYPTPQPLPAGTTHAPAYAITPCPRCQQQLRVPGDKEIVVTCPKCRHQFPFKGLAIVAGKSRNSTRPSDGMWTNPAERPGKPPTREELSPSSPSNHKAKPELPKTSAWDHGILAAVSSVAFVVAMPILFPAAVMISAINKVRDEYKKSGLWISLLMAVVMAAGLYFLFTPTPGCDMYGTTYSCAR